MTEYIYSRSLVNGKYDINNPNRIDEEGNPILLATEIATQLSKSLKIICDATECRIVFNVELTPEEKTFLDALVSKHKSNI